VRLWGERDLLSATATSASNDRGSSVHPLLAPLLLVLAAALWGTTGSSQALLGGAVPSGVVGALRILVGGVVLMAVAAHELPSARESMRAAWPLLLATAVSVAVYQLAFFAGVRLVGIAVGTILTVGSAPFVAGLLSIVLGHHRPSRRWALTTLVAVIGLVLLVRPDGALRPPPAGVVAALVAGAAFAVYTVLAKRLMVRGVPRLTSVAVPFLLGGLLLIPTLVTGLARAEAPEQLLTVRGLLIVGWLGVVATAVSYVLFSAGLRGVPAVTGTTLALAEPLTATVLGIAVFGERLSVAAMLGAAAVATALVAAAARPERDPVSAAQVTPAG
jgi:drug/metabolite transporter, DME family